MVTITITWQLILLVVVLVFGIVIVPKEKPDWATHFIYSKKEEIFTSPNVSPFGSVFLAIL